MASFLYEEVALVLNQAADLLEKTDWCQGYFARDANGRKVLEFNSDAQAYSLTGAILKVSHASVREAALLMVCVTVKSRRIELWNDVKERTKEEVITKLREAATAAKAYFGDRIA